VNEADVEQVFELEPENEGTRGRLEKQKCDGIDGSEVAKGDVNGEAKDDSAIPLLEPVEKKDENPSNAESQTLDPKSLAIVLDWGCVSTTKEKSLFLV
jgi:hypothetical protein